MCVHFVKQTSYERQCAWIRIGLLHTEYAPVFTLQKRVKVSSRLWSRDVVSRLCWSRSGVFSKQ